MANLDECKLDKSKLNLDLLIRAGSDVFIMTGYAFEAFVMEILMSAISAQTRSANLQAVAKIEALYMRICRNNACYLSKAMSRSHISQFILFHFSVRLNTSRFHSL